MTLRAVKVFEAKFEGMVIRSEGKGKSRKLIRSKENTVIPQIGELDADEESKTYGKCVCKVGETYTLDEWQVKKYGGAFGKPKEVKAKGYTLDDGETPEEANLLSPKEIRARKAAKEKENKKLLAEKAKRDEEAAEREAAATTQRTTPDLQPTGKFADIEGSGGKITEKDDVTPAEASKTRAEELDEKGAGELKKMLSELGLPKEKKKADAVEALVAYEEKLEEVKKLDEAALGKLAEDNEVEVPEEGSKDAKNFDLAHAVAVSELYE